MHSDDDEDDDDARTGRQAWHAGYHPYPVSEPATLRGVRAPPLEYELRHPATNVSPMQRETARRALQSLARRSCFILGDGTGVGKGRTIALIVAEWLCTDPRAKATWVSANLALRDAALAELRHVGGEGYLDRFSFVTYAALARKTRAREVELLGWHADASASLLALDECHAMRHMGGTFDSVRRVVCALRPRVAAVYASATAMGDPKTVRYLPLAEALVGDGDAPFATADALHGAIKSSGTAFLELMCMHLKSRGMFSAWQLSLEGVAVRSLVVTPTDAHVRLYDECAARVRKLADAPGGALGGHRFRMLLGLLVGLKVEAALREADALLAAGESVVFTLCATGAAQTDRRVQSENLRVGDATPRGPRTQLAEALGVADDVWWAIPPLDRILAHYGEERVAEVTGRSQRLVRDAATAAWTLRRVPRDDVQAFQEGRKRVAVISRAGGLGISLHDTGAGRRTVIAIELPWSGEEFAQQLGRVHRASNRSAPSYVLACLRGVHAEQRVIQTLLRRTASLGALMRGDRDACDTARLRDHAAEHADAEARRALALRVAARQLADAHGLANAELVRAARRAPPAHHVRAAAADMANSIHECATHADGARPAALRLLGDLVARHGRDVAPVLLQWSPRTHAFFGREVDAWVGAVLCAHAHADARRTLGVLPPDVLLTVIRAALDEAPDARLVARHLSRPPAAFAKLSADAVLNLSVLMPIRAQRALEQLMHRRGWARARADAAAREQRQCSLLSLARARVGQGIDVAVAGVRTDARGYAHVTLRYTPRPVPDPPAGALFYARARSATVAWVRTRMDEAAHSASGAMVAIDTATADEATAADFDARRRAHARAAAARAARARTLFVVSTVHGVRDWERSERVVVRFADPADGAATAGVLLGPTGFSLEFD